MAKIEVKNLIVGAGAMGAAAAYHLALRGEPVALVEQFALGHNRGSSHGALRITRHSYADLRYARLMPEAFAAWRELEARSCRSLYIRTGGLSFAPESNGYVAQVAANLAEIGVPHRLLSGREITRALPQFSPGEDHNAVSEPDAGMLLAGKAVGLQIELAAELGRAKSQIFVETPIVALDLEGSKPVARSSVVDFEAERLIVTAGSWVGRLFPGSVRDLTPTRQQVIYLDPTDRAADFSVGSLPVFIYKGASDDDQFYGMPGLFGAGVKVARHGGPVVDPDKAPATIDPGYPDVVRSFLARFLPSLAAAPLVASETCLYTVAPDDAFRIGFHRGRNDVLIASPCSGHGFKFSCLIGRVLADLITTGETPTPIVPPPWRFDFA